MKLSVDHNHRDPSIASLAPMPCRAILVSGVVWPHHFRNICDMTAARSHPATAIP